MEVSIEDIETFFYKSSRDKNDACNKVRERILNALFDITPEFLENPDYGEKWRTIRENWLKALDTIAFVSEIGDYKKIKLVTKGGRSCHYEIEVCYITDDNTTIATKHIEFKFGCTTIDKIPQFLSLQAKFPMFETSFDRYHYDFYLKKYLECDKDGFENLEIPTLEEYLKFVTSTNYSCHPFFARLNAREPFKKSAKNKVVNESITDYLKLHGADIDLSELEYLGLKNGNVLQIKSKGHAMIYNLLLRWRNHKGVLNPVWQISLSRSKSE